MKELYDDLVAEGDCLVCQKALRYIRPNCPYSFKVNIPDAPNDETFVHRILYRERYPETPQGRVCIARKCATKGCVKPEHYMSTLC